jgi:hypothetical protein
VPVSASPAQALAAYLKVLRRSKEERAEVGSGMIWGCSDGDFYGEFWMKIAGIYDKP